MNLLIKLCLPKRKKIHKILEMMKVLVIFLHLHLVILIVQIFYEVIYRRELTLQRVKMHKMLNCDEMMTGFGRKILMIFLHLVILMVHILFKVRDCREWIMKNQKAKVKMIHTRHYRKELN